ncbi:MAG: DUF58 domain-containing protein [Rhizobacter sp.]|nr:DUF58 domain-containing protein [Rhizobacter sp.]
MAFAILPSRAAVTVVALLAAAASAAALGGVAVATVAVASGVAVMICLAFVVVDVRASRRAWRAAPLAWQRRLPPALAVGVRRAIEGQLVNASRRRWQVELFDHIDPSFDVDGLPAQCTAMAKSVVTLAYAVVPHRRGVARFAPAELRVRTILGSCELRVACGEAQTLRVYPNFATVSRYAWLAGDRRLAEIGIKSYPLRGSGTDFKQLADYQPGDAIRDIDWKATLRHVRPIVREYQDERDQSVVFLLDCGRRMRADEGGHVGSHFDAALEALMLLAYVALKEGDEIGAMTFGGRAEDTRSVAPRKGPHSLNALIGALHDVEPAPTQPDYRAAAIRLLQTLHKRSLVVVLTNFREEDAGEVAPALALLRTRHLVLLASLRERALREIAEQPLVVERDAIEVAGAHLFAQARDNAFRRLAAKDAYLLDVEPEHVAVELVNRYRAIKRAQLL